MLATAEFADDGDEKIVDHKNWTVQPVNYFAPARLEQAAASAGFRFERLGRLWQDWFVVFTEGNDAALRGAEAMRGVRWDTVKPKWQDPGLKTNPKPPAP